MLIINSTEGVYLTFLFIHAIYISTTTDVGYLLFEMKCLSQTGKMSSFKLYFAVIFLLVINCDIYMVFCFWFMYAFFKNTVEQICFFLFRNSELLLEEFLINFFFK